jgi:ABC-type glycerol-3-phosphate transport system permease component
MSLSNKSAIVIKRLKIILIYFFLVLIVLVTTMPVITMMATSFKGPDEILSSAFIFPKKPSIFNYNDVLTRTRFSHYLVNSIFVSIAVAILSTIISTLAGYSLSRYSKKLKLLNLSVYLLLIIQMFPALLVIIPMYIIIRNVGIDDTYWAIFLIYISFSLPLNIWMLQGFFDGIPIELEEAALIDGASRLTTLIKIVVPVASPGVASVAIFAFNYCWNEYLFSSIFLRTDALRTMTVGLASFKAYNTTAWGSVMAASTIAVLPITIFLVFMQNYIVRGLTAGAIKA